MPVKAGGLSVKCVCLPSGDRIIIPPSTHGNIPGQHNGIEPFFRWNDSRTAIETQWPTDDLLDCVAVSEVRHALEYLCEYTESGVGVDWVMVCLDDGALVAH